METDLFAIANPAAPLAERLRPKTVADVIGQRHLLAPGKPLAVAFATGKPHSMILWGPPGVGKTTLARLMADAFNADFIALSAVLSGVKDIRDSIARAEATLAQSGRHTILFVDEVHRFNKAQQDAFLPYVEQGLVTFIGATTENPSFEVNSALLSRATVYVLEALDADELAQLLVRALAAAMPEATLAATARDAIISYADGDGRRLLNLVEQLGVAAQDAGRSDIDLAFVEATITRSMRRFDKGGEAFYDQISALHKSVRGSDPDASLYWFCRMLDGGADPLYVGRRMIRMASEDIGLADPRALPDHARRGGDLRASGDARRRARAGRGSHLSRLRGKEQRGVRRLQRRPRVHRQRRLAAGAASPAQRADATDEESRLRQGLPLRAQRGRRLRRGRALFPRRHGGGAMVSAHRARTRGEDRRAACRAPQSRRSSAIQGRRQVLALIFAVQAFC